MAAQRTAGNTAKLAVFFCPAILLSLTTSISAVTAADEVPGYYTDPATGIVYRKVVRRVTKPVVETKMTQRQQTVYQPEKVVDTRPVTRQTYTPVTEFRWKPKIEGRWNPFKQPRVAYQHVPETHWETRQETIAQTTTHVRWKPETKTVSVPEKQLRMVQDEQVDFEPVGRIAVAPSPTSQNASASNLDPNIAARLRPLSDRAQVAAISPQSVALSNEPGRGIARRDHVRTSLQNGLRATELMPGRPSMALPTTSANASGIAGLPPLRIWR